MFEYQQPEPWPGRARSPRRDGVVHAVMIHDHRDDPYRWESETACGLDAETYRVLSPDNAHSQDWYVACERCRRAMRRHRSFWLVAQKEKGT